MTYVKFGGDYSYDKQEDNVVRIRLADRLDNLPPRVQKNSPVDKPPEVVFLADKSPEPMMPQEPMASEPMMPQEPMSPEPMMPQEPMSPEPMMPEPLALRAGPQPPEDKTPPPLSLRDKKNFPGAEATTVASRDKDEGSATSAATPFSIPTS